MMGCIFFSPSFSLFILIGNINSRQFRDAITAGKSDNGNHTLRTTNEESMGPAVVR